MRSEEKLKNIPLLFPFVFSGGALGTICGANSCRIEGNKSN